MAESTSSSRKRTRRSSKVSRNLEQARQRLAHQLAEERAREERIKAALREYMAEDEKIAGAHRSIELKVTELEQRIVRLREQAEEKIAGARITQARAALAMHEAGRTVEQVAELVNTSTKEARRLIAAGREADPAGNEDAAPSSTVASSESPADSSPDAARTQLDPVPSDSEPSVQGDNAVEPGGQRHDSRADDGTENAGVPAIVQGSDWDRM